MFGKLKAGEEVAKRAGFTEAAKDLAIAAAKTAPKEGLTEAAQEVIGIMHRQLSSVCVRLRLHLRYLRRLYNPLVI
jgi:ABC-type hemin transport system substrate-binding protein